MKLERKRKGNKLYIFAMVFIIISFNLYLFYQYYILQEHDKYINDLKAQIEQEQNLHTELENQNEYKNSKDYIEKIAREKLGMVKSDEIVFLDKE